MKDRLMCVVLSRDWKMGNFFKENRKKEEKKENQHRLNFLNGKMYEGLLSI